MRGGILEGGSAGGRAAATRAGGEVTDDATLAAWRTLQRLLDPLRLRLLVEVERRGSIVQAARACSISQPSASMHLHTLESALRHPLLERNGRSTRLTEAGKLAARQASKALDALDQLQQELGVMAAGEAGIVTVATCADFAISALPSVLGEFAERHPFIDVRVAIAPSEDVLRRVARGEAHVGIAGELDPTPGVRTRHLMDDALVGISAPGLLPLRDGRVPPADLEGITRLVRARGSSTRAAADRYLSRVGWRATKLCELDSVEAVKQAVRYGLGVAFVSRVAVADELETGALEAFELDGMPTMERPLVLVQGEHHDPTVPEEALIATLDACATAGRGSGVHREAAVPEVA